MMNRTQGILTLRIFMVGFKQPMGDWYVGIANDPSRRLFTEHKVPPDYIASTSIEAQSAEVARKIETFFIEKTKTDGGQRGGDVDARFVYAFLKTKETDPSLN